MTTKKETNKETENNDLQERRQKFIEDVEVLEEKHGFKLSAELVRTRQATFPRLTLVDKTAENDQENTETEGGESN